MAGSNLSLWLSSGRSKKLWRKVSRATEQRCGLMADQVREQGHVMHYTCVGPSRFVIWAEEAMGALSDNWFVRVGEVPPVVLWSEGWKWRYGPGWSCSVGGGAPL